MKALITSLLCVAAIGVSAQTPIADSELNINHDIAADLSLSGSDSHRQSMAVKGGIVYVSDDQLTSPSLLRFRGDSGEPMSPLAVAVDYVIGHVGVDAAGALYVAPADYDRSAPTVRIDMVDPATGASLRSVSRDLTTAQANSYYQLASVTLGHPDVRGSLAAMNDTIALTEVVDLTPHNTTGIRAWRLYGAADGSLAESRISELRKPDVYPYEYITPDPLTRIVITGERTSITDNTGELPSWYSTRNAEAQVRSQIIGRYAPEASALGLAWFRLLGGDYIVYAVAPGVARLARWTNGADGFDGEALAPIHDLDLGEATSAVTLIATEVGPSSAAIYLRQEGGKLHRFTFGNGSNGVTMVGADTAEPAYYDLRGMVVAKPARGQLLIERTPSGGRLIRY